MDKKIAGLLGAVGALASLNSAQAATDPVDPAVLKAQSYADLLRPIPNAKAALKAVDEADDQAGTTFKVAENGHHHHHHIHAASADSVGDSSANNGSSGTSIGSSVSQTLSQFLSLFQSNSTQSEALNPATIIMNTLSTAGIGGSR